MDAQSQQAARAAARAALGAQDADEIQARWHVGLLGGLRLSDGAQHLTRLPSRAVTALLARLAMAPERAHPREELIELLWPGVDASTGRNRLRQALSTLKSVLEPAGQEGLQPVLLADRNHVRVHAGSLACDAVQFERHVRAGRAAAAQDAYRGELLPGFYDDWIDEERLRLAALHDRVAFAAQPQAETLTPPASQRAPDAQPTPRRVTLPSYLTRMFGAHTQAERLRALVLAQRLVTLVGPGGAGKTRLAVEVAHSLREHADWPLPVPDPALPFDLIAFVQLAACTTRAQMSDALTGALQIEPGAADALHALTEALSGRRALLVLDNFEQLAGLAEDLIEQLVTRLPGLHVLVTSRRPLGLDGEHEFGVATLELPPRDAGLEGASGNAAVELFVERARAVRSDFHLSARNAPTLVALVRALEGMPLAIELAASRVRSIAPAQMLARLGEPGTPRLDLLARSGTRSAPDARHASMQRAIAWSWELLEPQQAQLLCALTVFAGEFTGAAVFALVGAAPGTQQRLDELVANSLVHAHVAAQPADADDTSETWRFSLYQPIREYAATQLDAATAHHWRGQLRAWALHWAQTLPTTPPLDLLRQQMPNLLAVLASAVDDGAPADAIDLLLALRRCLEDVELPAAGLVLLQAALDQCSDAVLRSRGHSALGPMLFTAGQPDAALRHAELGLQCAELDAAQRARALHSLARVRWRSRRRAADVEPLLDEAQALLGEDADLELRASLLALRAFVTNGHHRDHVKGEYLHAQALALWERQGNQHAIDSGRYNLAVCAQNLNRNTEVLHRIEPIIASARALNDWRRLSQSLNVRGNAHSGLHDWAKAFTDYQECIRIAWSNMASFDLAFGLWNLPRALLHLRRPEPALRLAAFAQAFWRNRFGDLSAADQRYLQRVRRLAARQLDAARIDALWREGQEMALVPAVGLALGLPAAV